jgi:predicted RNase H-like HicB family nuclease
MKTSKGRKSIRFLITKDEEGWHAQAEGISIFTEGNTLEELKDNIKKAVKVHLADGEYKKYGLSSETPEIFLAYNYEESLA